MFLCVSVCYIYIYITQKTTQLLHKNTKTNVITSIVPITILHIVVLEKVVAMPELVVKKVEWADPVDVSSGRAGVHPPVVYDGDTGVVSVFSAKDGLYLKLHVTGELLGKLNSHQQREFFRKLM